MHASCVRSTTAASALTQQTALASRIGVQIRLIIGVQLHWAKGLPATVPQASSRRASAGSQQQRAFASSGLPAAARHQQQQQQQQWPQVEVQEQQLRPPNQQPLLPDPEADDLDFLAAAAAVATPLSPITNSPSTSTPTGVTQAAATRSSSPAATAGAAGHVPISPITSIPDAGPRYALPVGKTPRYTAADKLQLSGEEMRDIGRRLRRVRRGAQSVLRVFR